MDLTSLWPDGAVGAKEKKLKEEVARERLDMLNSSESETG
jgi:hypothetical protein